MKQIAILFAAVCAMTLMAGESQAQFIYGGGGFRHAPIRTSGFSVSIGSGFNQFGRGHFGAPIYRRPVYGVGGFGGGFPGQFHPGFGGFNRGVGISVGRGFGGYGGFRPGCGW